MLTHLFHISYCSALFIFNFVLPFQSFISRRTFHKKRKQVALIWFPQTFSFFNVWSLTIHQLFVTPSSCEVSLLSRLNCKEWVVWFTNHESCDSPITSRVIPQLWVVWFPNHDLCESQNVIRVNCEGCEC